MLICSCHLWTRWEKKRRWKMKPILLGVFWPPQTPLHISSSVIFVERNIFRSHSFLFHSTSVGFCPRSQRAPLFSRKYRCHAGPSDLDPASRCLPVRRWGEFWGLSCNLLLQKLLAGLGYLHNNSRSENTPIFSDQTQPFGHPCTGVQCAGYLSHRPEEEEKVQGKNK